MTVALIIKMSIGASHDSIRATRRRIAADSPGSLGQRLRGGCRLRRDRLRARVAEHAQGLGEAEVERRVERGQRQRRVQALQVVVGERVRGRERALVPPQHLARIVVGVGEVMAATQRAAHCRLASCCCQFLGEPRSSPGAVTRAARGDGGLNLRKRRVGHHGARSTPPSIGVDGPHDDLLRPARGSVRATVSSPTTMSMTRGSSRSRPMGRRPLLRCGQEAHRGVRVGSAVDATSSHAMLRRPSHLAS